MIELLAWLSKSENALADALSPVSRDGLGGEALMRVVEGKRRFSRTVLSTASTIRSAGIRLPSAAGLARVRDDLDSSLSFICAAVAAGERGAGFAEALAVHEGLKWNGLILTVAAALKGAVPGGATMLSRAQRHKRAVEAFLESAGAAHGLFRLRASEPAWVERILIVGAADIPVEDALRRDGVVERAGGAKEAIERLRERYYAALITDGSLPDLDGIELSRRASRIFPGIEERFLFLYSEGVRSGRPGRLMKGSRTLSRSASFERIVEEVGLILDR